MSNTTQNDWEKRFDGLFNSRGLDHVECFDEISHRNSLKNFFRKELADARKEVMDKIEGLKMSGDFAGNEAMKILGVTDEDLLQSVKQNNDTIDRVLATLREE